jgi:hypothetical protein
MGFISGRPRHQPASCCVGGRTRYSSRGPKESNRGELEAPWLGCRWISQLWVPRGLFDLGNFYGLWLKSGYGNVPSGDALRQWRSGNDDVCAVPWLIC